jgi:hypothetical protein
MEISDIQGLIDKGHTAQRKYVAIHSALNSLGFREEDRWRGAPEEQIQLMKKYTDERNVAFDRAIHQTLAAYQIVPTMDGGLAMPGGRNFGVDPSRTIYWRPVADDNVGRPAQGPNGKVIYVEPVRSRLVGKPVLGATAFDGSSAIFPDAFTTPGALAMTLYHEKIHFDQITTEGKGDRWSEAEMELDAYDKEIKRATTMGLTPFELKYEMADATAGLRHEVAEVEKERNGFWSFMRNGSRKYAVPSARFAHVPADFEEIEKRFNDIREAARQEGLAVRAEVDRIQKARAEAERKRQEVPPTPVEEVVPVPNPERVDSPVELAAAIATRGCRVPWSIREPDMEDLYAFHGRGITENEISSTAERLDPCARRLFFKIIGRDRVWPPRGRASAAWINDLAKEIRTDLAAADEDRQRQQNPPPSNGGDRNRGGWTPPQGRGPTPVTPRDPWKGSR